MSASVWFTAGGEAAALRIVQALNKRGCQVLRSFDLRSAAIHWADGSANECQCPHHGTAQCTCQYIVLLAYGPDSAPAVITIHSQGDRCEVRIVQDSASTAESALAPVALAVLDAAVALQSQPLA